MNIFIQLLTYFRIIIAPIIFLCITYFHAYEIALIFFILASVSDFLDGFLARKYNFESTIGKVLDPVADKILTTFLFISLTLSLNSFFIGFAGSIILGREFLVGGLREYNSVSKNSDATKVTFLAKVKTTTQFVTFTGFLLGLLLNSSFILFLSNILLLLSVIITLQTGLSYLIATFKKLRE